MLTTLSGVLSGKQDCIVYGAFCGKMSPSCGPHTETRVEKDVTMDNGNGSTPREATRQGTLCKALAMCCFIQWESGEIVA